MITLTHYIGYLVRLSKPFSLRGWLEDQLNMRGYVPLVAWISRDINK